MHMDNNAIAHASPPPSSLSLHAHLPSSFFSHVSPLSCIGWHLYCPHCAAGPLCAHTAPKQGGWWWAQGCEAAGSVQSGQDCCVQWAAVCGWKSEGNCVAAECVCAHVCTPHWFCTQFVTLSHTCAPVTVTHMLCTHLCLNSCHCTCAITHVKWGWLLHERYSVLLY